MSEAARDLAGKRVMVLEDEFFLADDLAHALLATGAQVLGPYANLRSAQEALATTPAPDFAVLDVNIRGQTCFPLAEALAARGVPYVFLTGYDQALIPKAFAEVPRYEKPLDAHRLVRALSA